MSLLFFNQLDKFPFTPAPSPAPMPAPEWWDTEEDEDDF